MEKLQDLKFQSLQEDEMKELKGGRWHVEASTLWTGETFIASYRTNIFGSRVEEGEHGTD